MRISLTGASTGNTFFNVGDMRRPRSRRGRSVANVMRMALAERMVERPGDIVVRPFARISS